MELITYQFHINKLPNSPIKKHIQNRHESLSFGTDVPPNIVLVEPGDEITGADYRFVGNLGLISDQRP